MVSSRTVAGEQTEQKQVEYGWEGTVIAHTNISTSFQLPVVNLSFEIDKRSFLSEDKGTDQA